MDPEKALAEIVHLPTDRLGNIIMRPSIHEYEIPYLNRSNLSEERQISIDDLYISINDRRILKLRSKRLNKEVKTRLSNAHDYSTNQLPVYQFLANFQSYGKRNWIGFTWGPLENMFNFLPRIEYQGLILSKAKWRIKKREVLPFFEILNNKGQLSSIAKDFFENKQIPEYVSLVEGDNTLLLSTKNTTCLQMLFNQVKNKESFLLEEFLHAENGPVQSKEDYFTNQFVISMYNAKKLEE